MTLFKDSRSHVTSFNLTTTRLFQVQSPPLQPFFLAATSLFDSARVAAIHFTNVTVQRVKEMEMMTCGERKSEITATRMKDMI
ncbi:hypothetical protein VNO78_03527 [Psophocarpus tetragonolobus]|uniref:Uncharacterized protein n=1 Tax=Psophocarpus tetragonolobus TaxID=3891 RepID=A0AAN9XVN4_PSOTE